MITLGVLRTPSVLAGKQSTKGNRPLACGLFLLYPARALMVTLCRQLRVALHHQSILHNGHHPPWLHIRSTITPRVLRIPSVLSGKQSISVNWPSASGLFLLYPARPLMVRPYADISELSSTPSYTIDTNLPGLE